MVSGAERVVRIASRAKPGDLTGCGDQTKGSASEIEDQDDERSVCRPKHFNEVNETVVLRRFKEARPSLCEAGKIAQYSGRRLFGFKMFPRIALDGCDVI